MRNFLVKLLVSSWAILYSTCENRTAIVYEFNIIRDYNKLAKRELIESFESLDLYPMTSTERCILKEIINRDLDKLNNYKLIQFDSLCIRNYVLDDLGTRFSIAMKDGNFYLLLLPRILEYWYTDNYYHSNAGLFELRKPEFCDWTSQFC
ncbi:MAG TPA: hypothetical protein VK658_05750 [Chryseolinea sp.]|nr:hypothetical protein [Chryseolinea sp.]